MGQSINISRDGQMFVFDAKKDNTFTRLILTSEELAQLGDLAYELYNDRRRPVGLLMLGKDPDAKPDRPSTDVP